MHCTFPNKEWNFEEGKIYKFKEGQFYGEVNDDEEPNGYGIYHREEYIGDFYKVHGNTLGYGWTVDRDKVHFGFKKDGHANGYLI